MAIKKKVRVLTPEEAREKQLKDYTPFWINSDVIFGANLFPVDGKFTKQTTVLFLLDAADYTTERVMDLLQNWKTRYANLPWDCVFVFQQKYIFLKNQKFLERFKQNKIFLDTYGELFERFGSTSEAVAVILKNGEFVSSVPLLPNFSEQTLILEQELQKSMRRDDHGLPLLPAEKFTKKTVATDQKKISKESVVTSGEWSPAGNLLITQKNNATLSLPFKGKHLRFVGLAHPESKDSIKVIVTLNDKTLSSQIKSQIVHDDESGSTIIELNRYVGVYDIIQSETEVSGIVKLNFTNAYDNGVIFYEFKVAS